jgi:Pvc16 N-terminal domain/CarboxypepD_reg-like domain
MINDLNETIKRMLVEGVPLDTSEIDVVFEAPTAEWSSSLARPTINCYLYHIAENQELRHANWETDRAGEAHKNGSHPAHLVQRRRTPFRLDVHYLITAWANEVEDEHRLLWRAISALIKYKIIPQEQLYGELGKQEWPVPVKIAQPEMVLKNPSDFWSSMETHMKPSVTVAVTLPLDPALVIETPLVLTKRIRLHPDMNEQQAYWAPIAQIGGWVLVRSGESSMPVPGVDVLIVERGTHTQTGRDGKFKFDHVPRGRYTLRASSESGQAERSIEVPGEDYDLVLVARPAGEVDISEAGESPGSHQRGKGRRR